MNKETKEVLIKSLHKPFSDEHSRHRIVGSITGGMIIFAMIFAAVLLNQKEIIFPETAALVTGALISERSAWEVSRVKFVTLMTVSALAGYAVSAFLPIPMILKIFICFVFAAICLTASRCTLVPIISACILPLLMQTDSIIYPISVFVLSFTIALAQWILELTGIREKRKHKPVEFNALDELGRWTLLLICVVAYSVYPVLSGNYLYIAPPLIVMFVEMVPPSNKLRGKEIKIFSTTVLCALIGTECRLILTEYLELSMILSGAAAIIFVIILLNALKVYFPPSAALAFLPFIVNREVLPYYAVYIAVTSGVICTLSFVIEKFSRKRLLEK